METLYTAKDAAIALGKPETYRTLARRAEEAARRAQETGEPSAFQRVGGHWLATLDVWRAVALPKPMGRPPRKDTHETR